MKYTNQIDSERLRNDVAERGTHGAAPLAAFIGVIAGFGRWLDRTNAPQGVPPLRTPRNASIGTVGEVQREARSMA